MATYILKRSMFSLNKSNITYSDISLELGIDFPEEFKTLLRFEKSLDAETHYWASTNPGVYMTSSPLKSYELLLNKKKEIPILVDNKGNSVLHYDILSKKYKHNTTYLDNPLSLVNTILNQIDKYIESTTSKFKKEEVDGAEMEAINQNVGKYQAYRDSLSIAFGLPTIEQMNSIDEN